MPVGPRFTVGIEVIGVSLMGDWTLEARKESHRGERIDRHMADDQECDCI